MGLGEIGNLGHLVRQAQQVQAKLSEIQEEVGRKTVEASSGGGMVSVAMNGKTQMLSVKIDPSLCSANDRDLEMLEDLIVSAVNNAIKRAQALMAEEVAKLTGGAGITGIVG